MKLCEAKLRGVTPYSQGRHITADKLEGELDKAYEERTWRERLHVNQDGNVYIPPMAFKNCIAEIAKFLGTKIEGKRGATWTKHFEAGIAVFDPLVLPLKKEDIPGEWLFVPSDGKRGGQRRVDRCFPVIHQWEGIVTFHILDDIITEKIFRQHLEKAGMFIGIGRFRPKNNGYYGRFEVVSMEWVDKV